jgi:hypothetical protein
MSEGVIRLTDRFLAASFMLVLAAYGYLGWFSRYMADGLQHSKIGQEAWPARRSDVLVSRMDWAILVHVCSQPARIDRSINHPSLAGSHFNFVVCGDCLGHSSNPLVVSQSLLDQIGTVRRSHHIRNA